MICLFYVYGVLPVYISVQCLRRPEEGIKYFGTRIIGGS